MVGGLNGVISGFLSGGDVLIFNAKNNFMLKFERTPLKMDT